MYLRLPLFCVLTRTGLRSQCGGYAFDCKAALVRTAGSDDLYFNARGQSLLHDGLPAEFPFVMEPDLVVPVFLPELLSVKSSAKS